MADYSTHTGSPALENDMKHFDQTRWAKYGCALLASTTVIFALLAFKYYTEIRALRKDHSQLVVPSGKGATKPLQSTQSTGEKVSKTAESNVDHPHAVQVPANKQRKALTEEEKAAIIDKYITSDPNLMQLYVRQDLIRIRDKYQVVYAALGLSTDQIARFEQAYADYSQLKREIAVSALATGLAKDDKAAEILVKTAAEERDRLIKESMTEEQVERYESFAKNEWLRNFTDTLASKMTFTSEPLTADQALKVLEIVGTPGENGIVGNPLGEQMWLQNKAKYEKILSPGQIAALENMREVGTVGRQVAKTVEDILEQHQRMEQNTRR